MEAKKLSKDRMKKYMARRKWQVIVAHKNICCTSLVFISEVHGFEMCIGMEGLAQTKKTHNTSLAGKLLQNRGILILLAFMAPMDVSKAWKNCVMFSISFLSYRHLENKEL